MSAPVFLSYRREDSGAEAIAIRTTLRQEFGEDFVFMDTSSIQAGAVWPEALQEALKAADTVLVLIGPDWLRAGSNEWGQRRIDQKDDWVRKELALAFREDKKVIPVLVRGARIPPPDALPESIKALSQRQVIEIRRDYWNQDIKLLLAQFGQTPKKHDDDSKIGLYSDNFLEEPEPINASHAVIGLERTSKFIFSSRKLKVFIDDKKVGSIVNGSKQRFEVNPGKHTIQLKIDLFKSQKLSLTLGTGDNINLICWARMFDIVLSYV